MSNNDLVEIVRNHPDYQEYHSPEFDRVLEAMLRVDRIDFLPEKVPVAVTVEYQAFMNMANAYMFLMDDSKTNDDREKAYLAMLGYIGKLPDFSSIAIFEPRNLAYEDRPLPIGQGQTCSQPSLVAFMVYWLELEKGMKIFELGYGCGYSAAVTYHLIEPSGQLVAAEIIPPLTELGKRNLEAHLNKLGLKSKTEQLLDKEPIKLISGDGLAVLENEAPFDRIYLTAGVNLKSFDPSKLARYLNPDKGILLFPEEQGDLIKQRYENGNLVDTKRHGNGRIGFVPLLRKNT